MATKQEQESGPPPPQVRSIAMVSYWLTPAEQESLRQNLRDANAYFQKVFAAKNSAKSQMQEMDNLCPDPVAVNHASDL